MLAKVPFTSPLMLKAPPAVWRVRWSTKVSAVFASPNVMAAFDVLTVPPKLMLLGAVANKPPVKVKLSVAALPSFKSPVFKNVVLVGPVTCVLLPNSSNT